MIRRCYMEVVAALVLVTLALGPRASHQLYYDGITSYSIYPRLDVQLCANSSFSFDFALSTSSSAADMPPLMQPSKSAKLIPSSSSQPNSRLLIYSEQQIEITTNPTMGTKKLINSYFLIKLVNGDRLVVNDYWNVNEINIQLPIDFSTSWFRFVYTRRLNLVDVNLYKFDTAASSQGFGEITPKLVLVFSKQITHNNYIMDTISPLLSDNGNTINVELRGPKRPGDTSTEIKLLPPTSPQMGAYSHLFVGGIGSLDTLPETSSNSLGWTAPFNQQLKHLSKFHGYIMNLQYTSLSSQCSVEMCSKASISQRQYAIFSLSKKSMRPAASMELPASSAPIAIDDICESDTLTHDICPKDCSCLSNNFVAPYFNCDCSETPQSSISKSAKCSQLYKSFSVNFDDSNYFGSNVMQDKEKFEYPILNSFSKLSVQVLGTSFDRQKGIQFRSAASKLTLMPSTEITDSDACFWNIEDCANGFVQHMILSIDRLDEKKYSNKVTLFVNGETDSSKLLAYVHKNRLHFSLFDSIDSQEWLVSSYTLVKHIHLSRPLKITLTFSRDKYLALHIDGFLIDMCSKPSAPPLNHDIYFAVNSLYKSYYEFGLRLVPSGLGVKDNAGSTTIINHQFSVKYLRREYFNDLDGQDSKILVSSPAPSEIIKIDNTQRVMYKIDSPLTGVTMETIELSFRTSQPDGVIFYIRNQPVITYFELIHGQPVVVIDTRVKNIYLRPQTAPLNDNKWHDVKLHRDGRTISINIDSQCHDSSDLEQNNYQILTGGYVYLGLADPNNINLSDKKTFVGEMVRGKVTINNVQQRVVQQPYYWPSMPAITTNQTVNIDTSQLSHDGKMINIIINVYGPPGFNVNAQSKQVSAETGDTHFIYLDNLPDTRHISVTSSDHEIDFRVPSAQSSRLDSFLIKFQTRQECGQLVTLINDQRNYIGLEIFEGYLYSSSSLNGAHQRFQISRVRVDDGRIYQVHLKQEQQKLLCWLDTDDSYKQSIMYLSQPSIAINTVRVAGQDGTDYGFSSRYGFVGCIGAIIFNERDVIDYKYVPGDRRQSCQEVIESHPAQTPAPEPPSQHHTTPPPPVSLGYISFTSTADILVYNYFYDHEKPSFEDISFIFRTVSSDGILFSAHNNDEGHSPILMGAHIRDGYVYVVFLNSTYTQELYVNSTQVNDGNLYRLNIRRNSNGHGFIQLQSYVGVTPLDFYTQPGDIKFSKVIVGGADEWSRIRYFGTRVDFVGCIIDLFQINGNSVIKPADIPKDRYNCNVERRDGYPTSTHSYVTPRPECLPDGYPLSFQSVEDAVTYQHETSLCETIHIPFRTRDSRGIIYSHSSEDGSNYILVYLRRGYLNIVVRDTSGERECEMSEQRVDDGELHKLDLACETNGYLVATLDGNRQVQNRLELYSPMYLNSYTLGYFNAEKLSSRYSSFDNFRGCLEQVLYNKQCLIYEMLADRNRLTCPVQPISPQPTQPPPVKIPDIETKDERSIWTFKGPNSGNIEFIPYMPTARQAELTFQFQPKADGNIVCSRDDNNALRVDLKERKLVVSVSDVRSRRVLKTAECHLAGGEDEWHKVNLVKKNRGQISISCGESSQPSSLQHDNDIPFVNTKKYGVVFGRDCVDERTPRRFNGDLTQINYVHDGRTYSFEDLQYTEDPRFTYESYVEFRPLFISQVHSDPKPISFRSAKSSARLDRWDSAKVGRISFEFKIDIADESGLLFSTESGSSYFAIAINDGYLESILSPHRVPNGDTSVPPQVYYDRYQRLFPQPKTRVNDGLWHKLEFMLLGDSVGSFVLDVDFSSKVRFPINYWNEESDIVFGDNSDIKRETLGSFRGCVRNIVINNRLINWANIGVLNNVEAGCYGSKDQLNQLLAPQNPSQDQSQSNIQFNGNGCIKYLPRSTSESPTESLEFMFRTQSDQSVLFDSPGSDFLIHTQGPAVVVRNKDDSYSKAIMERGIAFNDGEWHKIRLNKGEQKVEVELDSKYKQDFPLTRRNKLTPFHVGCLRGGAGDEKLKFKLNDLRSLRGQVQSVVYSSGSARVDIGEKLETGDPVVLVEGIVHWSQAKKTNPPGQQVDRQAAGLRENSFLKLDKVNFDQNSNLSFWFKTSENDGLLAFVAPSITSAKQALSLTTTSFMAVELVNGSVSLLIFSSNREKPTRVQCASKTKLNDNKWHRIELKHARLGDYAAQMTTNPSPTITFSCDDSSARVKLTGEPKLASIQFNAGNLSSQMPTELWLAREAKFIGCLGGFRVNERDVDVYEQAAPESRQTLERGCAESAGGQCARGGGKCANQGECVDGYGRTYCNCESISFTGPRCDQPASTLSFNGSHSIDFTLIEPASSSSEEVSLRFRTRLRSGVLFVLKKSAEEPAMTISLEDGRVKCVYDRSKNDKAIYVGDHHQFNNNKWHTVVVRRRGPTVNVEVIDPEKQRYSVQDDLGPDFGTIRYEQVLVGGIRSVSLLQEYPNFIGWIQNVRLNGEDLLPYHLNGRQSSWMKSIEGNADPGENSLLLHHQITITSACPITLPRSFSGERFNLHLYFKTSQADSVILFRRGKEYRFMALELRGGRVRFLLDLGGGTKELVSEQPLNDRNWHEVTIRRFDRQKFAMKIDNFKEQLVDIGTSNPPLGELESFIIGGAVPDFQRYNKQVLTTEGFVGCLASIEINNDAPNLYSSMINMCPSVHHGCADLSCSADSCSHDGECSINNGQVSCNCEMTSYTGPQCKDNSNFYFFGKQNKACGFIKYVINPVLRNQDSDRLAFGFTTTDTEALLVRVEGDQQFIEIRLNGGAINLHANFANREEVFTYKPSMEKRLNDNTYHVVKMTRERNVISLRVDNYEQSRFTLKASVESCVFRAQQFIYVGAVQASRDSYTYCYYGIMTGMFFNGHYVLEQGKQYGDVGVVDYRYIVIDVDIKNNRTRPLPPTQICPLGYHKSEQVCEFSICPHFSFQVGDSCSCFEGYYEATYLEIEYHCVKRNDTPPAVPIIGSSAKYIPARGRIAEAPIGLILAIISGILLALLAAGLGARKCSDGLCIVPPRPAAPIPVATKVHNMFTSTTNTTNESYELNTARTREEVPLITQRQEEYHAKDALDMGYSYYPQPIYNQTVNETMEIYEQTGGGLTAVNTGGIGGTVVYTTLSNTVGGGGTSVSQQHHQSSSHHQQHHASARDLAMSSLFFSQNNNSADYELSNVTCLTMTPNGKFAIIGQSIGTPQIWDTLTGQLIRSMSTAPALPPTNNTNNLTLACNGTLLVGLSADAGVDTGIQTLQVWDVQTGKQIQLSHQIKCCVFALSQDTNSIFMAGNQRFGRGISVGVFDLVTYELVKEIKSDPTLSLGDTPESIIVTPDERHAIVGCRYQQSGTNFVVFDLSKASEIAQTKSIALDADPKCIQALSSSEVVAGTRGGHLIQWNIHSCQITLSFTDPPDSQAHLGQINQIALSADKDYLVSASSDYTAKVWNVHTKNLVSVLAGHRGDVTCVSVSNNDLVVTGSTDNTVCLWKLTDGCQISSMTVGMTPVEVHMAKHNKTIVAIGEKDGEQQLLMLRVISTQR